jgi:CheY-like chemotaxis protein
MSSKKILVVTGAAGAARAAYTQLLPHQALVFGDEPLQVLATLAEHRDVDAILVDLSASRRHGAEVLVRLAANPLADRIPLVVAGADDALLRSVKTARNGTSTAYVSAPLRKEELARALVQVTAPPATQRTGAA